MFTGIVEELGTLVSRDGPRLRIAATTVLDDVEPQEIYNLGAQSHVRVSFEMPEYVANTDGIGTLRILEAVRLLGLTDKCRIYQASTSELYGKVQAIPQSVYEAKAARWREQWPELTVLDWPSSSITAPSSGS